MARVRSWADAQLVAALSDARCLADVLRALGTKQQRTVVKRAAELGLKLPSGKKPAWTDGELRESVACSRTVREALQRLHLEGRGGNYKTFHRAVQRLGLDITHFVGRAHLAGQRRANLRSRRPLAEILVAEGNYENTKRLGERLIKESLLERRCYQCDLQEWRRQPIPLELDHVNGNRRDLRLENLRFLCPNCHAQTATYKGRNSGRFRSATSAQER